MKKMFLTLALVLVGSFAFASNEVNEVAKNEALEKMNYYVFLTDCGASVQIATEDELSVDEQFDMADAFQFLLCDLPELLP